jgi:hypothetical protein
VSVIFPDSVRKTSTISGVFPFLTQYNKNTLFFLLCLMNKQGYNYKTNDSLLDFEFVSEGPKGLIKKVIRFTPKNANGITYFNLGFGDWNELKKRIDDKAISNNDDKDKILVTVAKAVLEFTQHFPDVWVYAQGSTPARTRLYQMGIAAHWDEIEPLLKVYGHSQGKWSAFQKTVNYNAFSVLRKKK